MRIRQDIYQIKKDLNYLGENVAEAVAKPFESYGIVDQGFGKRQWDNTIGLEDRYHRLPKKPKVLKIGRSKKSLYNKFSMYRRKRFYGKKRRLTRSRGSKSLVNLIKRVSREPKRSVVATGAPGILASATTEGVPTELNIIQATLGPFTSQYGNQSVGNQYFMRGLKIKFYAYNPSNVPFRCTVSILTTKTQAGPRPALTDGQSIFYNPCAGSVGLPVPRSAMLSTPLHSDSPKIHPQGPYRELKRFVFTLASTTRNEGAVDATELDVEPSPNHADIKRWNLWMPINKEVKQNAGDTVLSNAGMPIRLLFWCAPAFYDLPIPAATTWDTTKLPRLMFDSIIYYRD